MRANSTSKVSTFRDLVKTVLLFKNLREQVMNSHIIKHVTAQFAQNLLRVPPIWVTKKRSHIIKPRSFPRKSSSHLVSVQVAQTEALILETW